MLKKLLFVVSLVFMTIQPAIAHDEGHGPKIKKQGKFGGKISSVILKSEELSKDAKIQYIAELTKNNDGKLRIYFYDSEMNETKILVENLKGEFSFKNKKTSKNEIHKFAFQAGKDGVEANIPKEITRLSNIEITFSLKGTDYFVAFSLI